MSLNDAQTLILQERADNLGAIFIEEVNRLIASGAVSPKNGHYPLSTVIKVALENVASREGYGNRYDYDNLRRF